MGRQDISHGIRAVQQRAGSVLPAPGMAIFQSFVETLTVLHLRWEEGFAQGTPVVIVGRSEDRLSKRKIMWRVAVMKKKTRPLRFLPMERLSDRTAHLSKPREEGKIGGWSSTSFYRPIDRLVIP